MKKLIPNEFDLFALAFAAPLLTVLGCSAELNVPPNAQINTTTIELEVQLLYTEHHSGVNRTLQLEPVSVDSSSDIPSGASCLDTTQADSEPNDNLAIPGNTVAFELPVGLCQGRWRATVTARDVSTGQSLFPGPNVTCDINLSPTQRYNTRRFTEGLTGCTGGSDFTPPTRNVSVDAFAEPPTVGQGDQVNIQVVYRNTGMPAENFNLYFKVDPATCGLPDGAPTDQVAITDFAPGVGQHTFLWDSTTATIGTHVLCVWIDPLAGINETNEDDNFQSVTVNVATRNLVLQNLRVLPSGTPVMIGDIRSVQVDIINNGSIDEEPLTIMLEDTSPGGGAAATVGTALVGSLTAGGGSATATYSWNTSTAGYIPGQHRLTASISDPVTASTLVDSFVERHDAQTVSVTAQLLVANVGDVIPVTVVINNNGTLPGAGNDNVTINLTAQDTGGNTINIDSRTVSAAPGSSSETFNWNTSCYALEGAYTLSATVSVASDSNSGNDTALAPGSVNLAFLHNQLTVQITTNPGNVNITGGAQPYEFQIINGNSVAETGVGLTFSDTGGIPGTFRFTADTETIDSAPPFDLACGETKTNTFWWGPNSASPIGEIHVLQLQIPPRLGATVPISTSNISVTLQ